MARIDRLATLYLARPWRRMIHRAAGARIPILMYHRISAEGESGAHPYFWINTSPQLFDRQMSRLRQLGYSSISLSEAVSHLATSGACKKNVVITFDDGYRDFYTDGFPVLQKYGFTATVFLPSAYIGETRRQFRSVDCLTWQEARELQKHGISFESHTMTHPTLTSLSMPKIKEELSGSKNEIENHLGAKVTTFSYPYAFPEHQLTFTDALKDALIECGYKNGVSTIAAVSRADDDEFFLPRLPVNSGDDLLLFEAKLRGDYDWLRGPQRYYKAMKSGFVHPNKSTENAICIDESSKTAYTEAIGSQAK